MGLDRLLDPESIAVVGASRKPEKAGNIILRNLSLGDFRLYPINPKEQEIMGLKCYSNLGALPEVPDIAIISLAASASVQVVAECVKLGIPFVISIAGGFAEIGAQGVSLQRELLELLKGSQTRLLGPNTMGLLVPSRKLDTLFLPRERSPRPENGNTALVSQSGSVMVGTYEVAEDLHMGQYASVGIGNKADLNENDLLEHFADDPRAKCIAFYLESFADARRFSELASKIAMHKPLVIAKVGTTPGGKKAAASHTGALASGTDALVSGALRQSGVIRVADEQELVDASQALAYLDHIEGDRIAVVGSAGGFGVIATDYVASENSGFGMRMASLSERTKTRIRSISPYFAAVDNPVDLTGAVTDQMYDEVLEVMQDEDGVDAILLILQFQPPNMTIGLVDIVEKWVQRSKKPFVACCVGGTYPRPILQRLNERGIPAYGTIKRAAFALSCLHERGKYLQQHHDHSLPG